MKKRKILHVIDRSDGGGAQVVLKNILFSLRDEFDFSIAILGKSGTFSDTYRAMGIPVHEFGGSWGRLDILALFKLWKLIVHEEFDLIHTYLLKSHIFGGVAACLSGKKLLIHDHTGIVPQNLSFYYPNKLFNISLLCLYKLVLSKAAIIIVLTPGVKKSYRESFGFLDESCIVVFPNLINIEEFNKLSDVSSKPPLRKQLGLGENSRVVVMVGRLEPEKDWLTFLKVASLTRMEVNNCWFLIVGSGGYESFLQGTIRNKNIEGVRFLGNRSDVPWILKQSDVFLLTSQHEAFGMVLLEAMAAGCPVVSTYSGGPQEIIEHGVTGLLCNVGDAPSLSAEVIRLLKQRADARIIAINALNLVQKKYDFHRYAEEFIEIYKGILGESFDNERNIRLGDQ